ncbi:hypothetical protein [Streptomyces cucumeris]|uniref:hypothetical protein n=1 Tax=Streptomyces cucumeris TaxID=2962890 RepID=UPI003EB9C7F3
MYDFRVGTQFILKQRPLWCTVPGRTERRNRIAHDADLLDGQLKRRREISDADVTDAIDWIERIALAIATVLG